MVDVSTRKKMNKLINRYLGYITQIDNNGNKEFNTRSLENQAVAGAVPKKKCFTCDVCKATFKEKHHIARHCKIHTGDKPYKCTICGKCFRDLSNFTNHKNTHNEAKRFECAECGNKFRKKDNLKVHWRTHNKEKPYKCNFCEKTYSTCGNLTRHQKLSKHK